MNYAVRAPAKHWRTGTNHFNEGIQSKELLFPLLPGTTMPQGNMGNEVFGVCELWLHFFPIMVMFSPVSVYIISAGLCKTICTALGGGSPGF